MGFVPELVVFVPIRLRNQIWDKYHFLARNWGAALSGEEKTAWCARCMARFERCWNICARPVTSLALTFCVCSLLNCVCNPSIVPVSCCGTMLGLQTQKKESECHRECSEETNTRRSRVARARGRARLLRAAEQASCRVRRRRGGSRGRWQGGVAPSGFSIKLQTQKRIGQKIHEQNARFAVKIKW